MLTLILKEIKFFFLSPIGYIIFGSYWTLNSLILIVFENEFNLFENYFLDFNIYFRITPWILLFMIPAIVMRSFSEEFQSGTIDLIISKPISLIKIIWSKFFGNFFLFLTSILPSIFYLIYLSQFSTFGSEVNWRLIIGNYFGLILLGSTFICICLPISIIFKNQISIFVTSTFFCFLFFFLFNQLAKYTISDSIYQIIINLGGYEHYSRLISGVISIKDIAYFFGLDILLIGICLIFLNNSKLK